MAKRESRVRRKLLLLRGIGSPDPALEGERTIDIADTAARRIHELAARVQHICSDKKSASEQKEAVCGLFFQTAYEATTLMLRLVGRFPQLFREIAEKSAHFPTLFPAHPDELRYLQKVILNDLNLGKHHPLKLRPAHGRKTFSQATWVNELLLGYLDKAFHGVASMLNEEYDDKKIAIGSKWFISPDNASRWLDLIWKLLLIDIPEPEKHPRLRQLGGRPSKAHDVRATIKAKLGTYLERMLNDQAVHK